MRTPGSRETVFQRQLGIGVLVHVYNAEIARGKRKGEAEEGDGDKYELSLHHRAGQRDPRRDAARGADNGQRALDERQQQRKDQSEITEFWNHGEGLWIRNEKRTAGPVIQVGKDLPDPLFSGPIALFVIGVIGPAPFFAPCPPAR